MKEKQVTGRVSISERLSIVDQRKRLCDREGDTAEKGGGTKAVTAYSPISSARAFTEQVKRKIISTI